MLRIISFTRHQKIQHLRRYLHDSKLPHVTGNTDLEKTSTIGIESPRKADYQMYSTKEAQEYWDSIVAFREKKGKTGAAEDSSNNRED